MDDVCVFVCVCVLPIVVMTVPAKKKAELRSHRLLWLVKVPAGFTPERIAETTCCKGKVHFQFRRLCFQSESVITHRQFQILVKVNSAVTVGKNVLGNIYWELVGHLILAVQ